MKQFATIALLLFSLLILSASRDCPSALYSVLKPKNQTNRQELSVMIDQFQTSQITPSYFLNNFKTVMELFSVNECNTQVTKILSFYQISGRCVSLLKDLSVSLYKLSHEEQNPFFYTLEINKLRFLEIILKKNCKFMQNTQNAIDFNKLFSFDCLKHTISYNTNQLWKNNQQKDTEKAIINRLDYLKKCGLINDNMMLIENIIKGQCFKQILTINKHMLLLRLRQQFTIQKLEQMLPQLQILKNRLLNACMNMNQKLHQ